MDKETNYKKFRRILALCLAVTVLASLVPGGLWNQRVSADESHSHDGWIDLAGLSTDYAKKITINGSGNYYLSSDLEAAVYIATEDTGNITVRICLCGHKLSPNVHNETVHIGQTADGTEETRGITTVLIENGIINSTVYAGGNTDVTIKNCTIKERKSNEGVSSCGELTLEQVSFEPVENLQGRYGIETASVESGYSHAPRSLTMSNVAFSSQSGYNYAVKSSIMNTTISDGTYISQNGADLFRGVITGGTFVGNDGYALSGLIIDVKGGAFRGTKGNFDPNSRNIKVSGGLFGEEVTQEYLAEGYVCISSNHAEYPYTVVPRASLPQYYVKYELNGGDGAVPRDDHAYIQAQSVALHDGSGISRAGYSFRGWALAADDTQPLGSVWSMAPPASGDTVTFYAVWEKNPVYTVSYHLNGGTGEVPVDSNVYTVGENVALQEGNAVTRKGYRFVGWALGSTIKKEDVLGDTWQYIIPEFGTNVTFYAVWERYYTVTYELNGGLYEDGEENPESYTYEDGLPRSITLENPYRTGYAFMGWTSDSNTIPNSVLTFSTALQRDLIYMANWRVVNYSISYDLDGGNAGNPYLYNITDGTFTLKEPTKQGYDFVGWTGSNGDTPQKSVTVSADKCEDLHYQAHWKIGTNVRYCIYYYYQRTDGSYTDMPQASEQLAGTLGEIVHADPSSYKETQDLTREELAGHFAFDADLSVTSGAIAADGSLVLKLYYRRSSYKVEFLSWDGTKTLAQKELMYDERITFDGETPAQEADDYSYHFHGWALQPNQEYGRSDAGLGYIKGNIQYYAAFEKTPNFCTVTYEKTDGFILPEDAVKQVNKGGSLTVSLQLAGEGYYVGTKEWMYTIKELHIYWKDAQGVHGLKLDEDFSYTHEQYGDPVVLTIPLVEHDLFITFCAAYHETHDYAPDDDTILTAPTCTEPGLKRHFCYKCGKTQEEVLEALGHQFSEEWESDGEGHWHTAVCGHEERSGYALHQSSEWIVDKPAAADEEGRRHKECIVCGRLLEEEILPKTENDPGKNEEEENPGDDKENEEGKNPTDDKKNEEDKNSGDDGKGKEEMPKDSMVKNEGVVHQESHLRQGAEEKKQEAERNSSVSAPKTGDGGRIELWTGLLVLAGAALVYGKGRLSDKRICP